MLRSLSLHGGVLIKLSMYYDYVYNVSQEFSLGARSPDCPLSLYEGWSGTVCFLLDILDPDKAAFPFSDVFI